MVAELLCGLQNQTTAPSYVVVDVTPKGEAGWRAAVESTTVAHAFALDRGWESPRGRYGEMLAQFRRTAALALTPLSAGAISALRPRYSPTQLPRARSHLAHYSDQAIREELFDAARTGEIRRFYAEATDQFFPLQAALAHALVERGFLPRRGDRSPSLQLVHSNCKENAA